MAIFPGAYYSRILTFKRAADNSVIDITGWTFRAQIRDNTKDTTVILELTTANGGLTVVSGPAGTMKMAITAAQTLTFPIGVIVGDVFRTDVDPGPVRLFGFKNRVKQPVTR